MRHHELSFLGFHSTRPMTAVVGGRLGETPLPPRGKSIAPNRGLPRPEHRYNSKTRKTAQFGISLEFTHFLASTDQALAKAADF